VCSMGNGCFILLEIFTFLFGFVYLFRYFAVLGLELRALGLLGGCSIT
jgi:hypothetical protein